LPLRRGVWLVACCSAALAAPARAQEAPPDPSGFYAGTAEAGAEASDTPKLELYGFIDFTYTKNLDGPDVPYDKFPHFGSFAVGNINLYAASDLTHGWRSLLEVRLLYLPHGSDGAFSPNGSISRTDTNVGDYNDTQRLLRWGGIEIERVFLEYQAKDWLAVKLGQFLTPYGIWNIDHGSPTVIPVRRPFVIGESLFPERQTGIEAHGAFLTGKTSLGYHVSFSNGKGPLDAYLDLDDNNAVGGRLLLRNTNLGSFTLGASAFYGKYTDRSKAYATEPGVTPPLLETVDEIVEQYDELSFGGDARWEYDNFLAQAEVIVNQRNYNDPYRRVDGGGIVADELNVGGYALMGYRTPWLGIMPYTMAESYNFAINTLLPPTVTTTTGLNIQPHPNVVFKLQYGYAQIGDLSSKELLRGTIHQVDAQAAWTF
jgi:hypothetical protein